MLTEHSTSRRNARRTVDHLHLPIRGRGSIPPVDRGQECLLRAEVGGCEAELRERGNLDLSQPRLIDDQIRRDHDRCDSGNRGGGVLNIDCPGGPGHYPHPDRVRSLIGVDVRGGDCAHATDEGHLCSKSTVPIPPVDGGGERPRAGHTRERGGQTDA